MQCDMMAFSFPDLFDNYMQQDAHEFLNYLLNTIADILQEEKKQEKQNGKLKNGNMNEPAENNKPELTWVHEIFQGTLTNETRCLNCETVSTGRCSSSLYMCTSCCLRHMWTIWFIMPLKLRGKLLEVWVHHDWFGQSRVLKTGVLKCWVVLLHEWILGLSIEVLG